MKGKALGDINLWKYNYRQYQRANYEFHHTKWGKKHEGYEYQQDYPHRQLRNLIIYVKILVY